MTEERQHSHDFEDGRDAAFVAFLEAEEAGRASENMQLADDSELAKELAFHQQFAQLAAPMRRMMSTILQPPAADEPTLPPGTIIGDYEIIAELGRGGMGVVYKARLQKMEAIVVALKVCCLQTTDEQRRRVLGEIEHQAGLKSPHIVPVIGGGEHAGRLFFTMEFMEGGDLARTAADAPMPLRNAAELVATIARGVHHAHQRQILHRDLKPQNVLLDAEGRPRVADFGLSIRIERAATAMEVVGAPAFMSPEQTRGEATVLSDVYGLGTILYWLLTRNPPFRGESLSEILEQVRLEQPPPPHKYNAALNTWLNRYLELICRKCLEKDPERRYPSADALSVDLQRWLNGFPPLQVSVRPTDRIRFWCRRRPALIISLICSLVLAVIATGFAYQVHQSKKQLEEEQLLNDENDFHAIVEKTSLRIADRFSQHGQLLAELRGSALVVLTKGEPKEEKPVSFANTLKATIYDQPAFVLAPGAHVEPQTLQKLLLLVDDFKRTMVRSRNRNSGLTDDEIRTLLLTKTAGKPLTCVYIALDEGVDCTYPGIPTKVVYDVRKRRWYVEATKATAEEVTWVPPYDDILGYGRVMSCCAPIFDYKHKFLGVAGFDLREEFVKREILRITERPHVKAFLVDRHGGALIPEVLPANLPTRVVDGIQRKQRGHVRIDNKLVGYFPLHVSGWYYVVVADSDHIREVTEALRGK